MSVLDADMSDHLNGHADYDAKGFSCSMIAVRSTSYDYEIILQHMKSGKSISRQEALDLHQVESLTSAIATLRRKGWKIVTESRKNEAGESFASYFLMPGAVQPDDDQYRTPLFDVQSAKQTQTEDIPAVVPEPVSAPVSKGPPLISIMNVRMGLDGPEIQMVPAGEQESDHPFCRPSLSQIRYLSLNLKLFTDLDDEKRR